RGLRAVPPADIPDRLKIVQELEEKGALTRALAEAQAILKTAPDDPAAQRMIGHLLFKLVRYPEARPILEKLVAAHPKEWEARLDLAAILNSPLLPGRDRALAEQMLLATLDGDPKNAAACAQLGEIYLDAGRYRQAAYVSTRMLEIVPDS